jgi:soluble P-type ATPase
MIEISIPGYRDLEIQHLVLDYNGTLACDGEIIGGVKESLEALSKDLQIHVVTADTFGKAGSRLEDYPCQLVVLPIENQDEAKLEYVRRLGLDITACMGNGRNDRRMLKASTLGIAVILGEGAATETLLSADVVCTDILSALGLLTNPLRLVATLRS